MRLTMHGGCVVLAGAIALMALPSALEAAPISAYERIFDPEPYDLLNRDLTRERWSSAQGLVTETDDATIIAENLVDDDFGITTIETVSYTHLLTWLDPPPASYGFGQLTITAWGNLGGDDVVFTDTFNLGALNDGTLFSALFSNTSFDVLAHITDGVLNVSISKNVNGGLGMLNAFSVFESRLDVRYEPVPEPAMLAMVGMGVAGLVAARRRRRS